MTYSCNYYKVRLLYTRMLPELLDTQLSPPCHLSVNRGASTRFLEGPLPYIRRTLSDSACFSIPVYCIKPNRIGIRIRIFKLNTPRIPTPLLKPRQQREEVPVPRPSWVELGREMM
jgi:hypothetical protein